MDKRMVENKKVKDAIANAYFALLKQKKSEDIAVTEITSKAKVSRMAYYRNFSSKLEIIEYYLRETMWQELSESLAGDIEFWTLEYGVAFFQNMKKYRDIILLLDDCGYANMILKEFNLRNEELAGDMPANSIERYDLYFASGASFNASLKWLRGGCKETPLEIAKAFLSFCKRM